MALLRAGKAQQEGRLLLALQALQTHQILSLAKAIVIYKISLERASLPTFIDVLYA